MEKLKSVVPYKAAVPAAPAAKPAPKPAKLSASESKELSIVMKSLTTKGAQALPSGAYFKRWASLQNSRASTFFMHAKRETRNPSLVLRATKKGALPPVTKKVSRGT